MSAERHTPYKIIEKNRPSLYCDYLEEPRLKFAGGRLHVDPKMGISVFGPRTLDNQSRHPEKVKVAFVGSGESIASAMKWIGSCSVGVSGEGDHIDFPGYAVDRGFFSDLMIDERLVETVTQNEILDMLEPRLLKDKFVKSIDLISDKLRLLSEKDQPPDYVVIALPEEILQSCRAIDYTDGELGRVHRDFKRVIKSEAMKYRLPTQILLQRTTEATDNSRYVEHRSVCAWYVSRIG